MDPIVIVRAAATKKKVVLSLPHFDVCRLDLLCLQMCSKEIQFLMH